MSLSVAFIGLGNLPRAFLDLLRRWPLPVPLQVTGIATGRHGCIVDPGGIDPSLVRWSMETGESLPEAFPGLEVFGAAAVVERAQAEVIVLATPLDPFRGEPGISLARR